MTIAISLKVHNGIVLAADSATTLSTMGRTGERQVINIFTTARKIFNLYKDKDVSFGLITWGEGGIGHASISTLAKELRDRLMGNENEEYSEYHIEKNNYKLEKVARLVRKYFFEELYYNEFKDKQYKPSLGFIVAGYSSGENLPEEWEIVIEKGICPEPILIRPIHEIGLSWRGIVEPITRLVMGYGSKLPNALKETGMTEEQVNSIIKHINNRLNIPLVYAPMPIQDAIDLAVFLSEATVNYSRFTPGAPLVGGPIDVAAITKFEGFKWVRRKLWYKAELNI